MYFVLFFILVVVGIKAQDCGQSFSVVGADSALGTNNVDKCYTFYSNDEDISIYLEPETNIVASSTEIDGLIVWLFFDFSDDPDDPVVLMTVSSDASDINNLEDEKNLWSIFNEDGTALSIISGVSATCGCNVDDVVVDDDVEITNGCVESFMADGECDDENNNSECNYDEGDCCECTCVDGDFECGDFECLDPSAEDCDSDDDSNSSDDDSNSSDDDSNSSDDDDSGIPINSGMSMTFSTVTVVCVLFSMIALV